MIMLFVVGTELLSVIFQIIHRSKYSNDGVGYPSMEKFTLFVSLVPDVILTALMVTLLILLESVVKKV